MKTKSWILISLILILAAGCGGGAKPTVAILSPLTGETFAEGEVVPLIIAASENSGAGIARVEILVDGALYKTEESPTGSDPSFNVTSNWQAAAPGGYNIMVIAYTPDDTPSQSATLVLNIDGEGAAASATSVDMSTPIPDGMEWEQGEASEDAYIRTGPGIYCEIIDSVDAGTIMNLMEYSASLQYLMTDVLGPTRIGWVWVDQLTILGDEDLIPKGNKLGCLGCGDGTCSSGAGENCSTCAEDCGSCCGNGTCEAGSGENCSTCATDCGSCCGNGTCEAALGENCSTCTTDCGACCGNGICEAPQGEDCSTCPGDCGSCCGNGICEAPQGETCSTCPADCGSCEYCGDGICNKNIGEGCDTCSKDCGACEYCGDGICQSWETSGCGGPSYCTADCGPC